MLGDPTRATAIAISRDSKRVALGDANLTVSVWNANDGSLLNTINLDATPATGFGVHALDFSADGAVLAIAVPGCSARLWTLAATLAVNTLRLNGWSGPLDFGYVRFSRDGTSLLTTTYSTHEACVWDARTLEPRVAIMHCGGSAHPMTGWIASNGEYVAMGTGWPVARVSATATSVECTNPAWDGDFRSDGDYAWGVVDQELVVRRIPDVKPILTLPIRDSAPK